MSDNLSGQVENPVKPERPKGLMGKLGEWFSFFKILDIRRIFQRHKAQMANPATKETASRQALEALSKVNPVSEPEDPVYALPPSLQGAVHNLDKNRMQGPSRPTSAIEPGDLSLNDGLPQTGGELTDLNPAAEAKSVSQPKRYSVLDD